MASDVAGSRKDRAHRTHEVVIRLAPSTFPDAEIHLPALEYTDFTGISLEPAFAVVVRPSDHAAAYILTNVALRKLLMNALLTNVFTMVSARAARRYQQSP
jgi:hypothetical protein